MRNGWLAYKSNNIPNTRARKHESTYPASARRPTSNKPPRAEAMGACEQRWPTLVPNVQQPRGVAAAAGLACGRVLLVLLAR